MRLVEEKVPAHPEETRPEEVKATGWFEPKVVYGFFGAQSEGNDLIVYNLQGEWKQGDELLRRRCASHSRASVKGEGCASRISCCRRAAARWTCWMSCVTIGSQASHETQKLFEGGEYTKYLYLHGLSVESAEALAELSHKRIRDELGIAGEDSPHIRDLFHQKYRGSRYSVWLSRMSQPGDQTKLFALLHPDETIGVHLTTGFLLDPEQSTSAIVVHHPAAKYFVV